MKNSFRKYGHNWTFAKGNKAITCHYCNGYGKVNAWDGNKVEEETCDACNGWGISNPEDLKEVD